MGAGAELDGIQAQAIRIRTKWAPQDQATRALLESTLRRGDAVRAAELRAQLAGALLSRDEPAAARAELALAREHFDDSATSQGSQWLLNAELAVDLYEGLPLAAWERIRNVPFADVGPLTACHQRELKMGAAVAAAAVVDDPQPLLLEATSLADELAGYPMWTARVAAARGRGAIAWIRGDREAALLALDRMDQACEDAGMRPDQMKAGIRVRRGQVLGGAQGATWIAEGLAALRHSGVVDPLRWLQWRHPGYPPPRF
ncbi:MAG: hypothetical protein OXT09_24695 [Myxococcales bacterium]|nr:hypothetical protein [Myxococcales bacterium]